MTEDTTTHNTEDNSNCNVTDLTCIDTELIHIGGKHLYGRCMHLGLIISTSVYLLRSH